MRNHSSRSHSQSNRSAQEARESKNYKLRVKNAESDSDTEDEEIDKLKAGMKLEITPDYVQFSRLIKYAKKGTPTATVLALLALREYDLTKEAIQNYFIALDGVSLLINLLQANDYRSKVASLKILERITGNKLITDYVLRQGGVQLLVGKLLSESSELSCLSSVALGNITKSRRGRKILRESGGLQVLLKHLRFVPLGVNNESPQRASSTRSGIKGSRRSISSSKHGIDNQKLKQIQCSLPALWNCCLCQQNRIIVVRANTEPYLLRLLEITDDYNIIVPVFGVIQCCSQDEEFRQYVIETGIVQHIINAMHRDNTQLKILALKTFKLCGEEPSAREEINKLDGLPMLLKLLHDGLKGDIELLAASTGAIWKSVVNNKENIRWFNQRKIADILSKLLKFYDTEVILNSLGMVTEFAVIGDYCQSFLDKEVLFPLMNHIETTDAKVITASAKAAKNLAGYAPTRRAIVDGEGLRYLWSHLKSDNEEVVISCTEAIHELIRDPKETSETVRSFLGGIELLLRLMKTTNYEVQVCQRIFSVQILIPVCQVVSRVAQDKENLGILDDYDLAKRLIELCDTDDQALQIALCRCISSYAINEGYRVKLRESILYLGEWIQSDNEALKQEVTHSLYKLSCNKENSMLIYKKGVVKKLVHLIGSDDEKLQEAAALCVKNIRMTIVAEVENTA